MYLELCFSLLRFPSAVNAAPVDKIRPRILKRGLNLAGYYMEKHVKHKARAKHGRTP